MTSGTPTSDVITLVPTTAHYRHWGLWREDTDDINTPNIFQAPQETMQ